MKLGYEEGRLVLKSAHFSPLCVDFEAVVETRRRGGMKKEGLVRACRPAPGLRIVDATAGWGRDAAVLASFGADVLMVEREPLVAALLVDGIMRLHIDAPHSLKLALHFSDTKSYLEALSSADYPDVIYIDPMHPTRQKSALVKKDMQVLQQWIGADEDVEALLACARSHVKQRVVLKWPQRLPALGTPVGSVEGKTVRFDIYGPLLGPEPA